MANHKQKKAILIALAAPLMFSPALLMAVTGTSEPVVAIARQAQTIVSVQQINPTTVDVVFSNNQRMTFDFYGDNIFRMFQDNNGGILRDPEAKPEARILVDTPRRPVSKLDIQDDNGQVTITTGKVRLQLDKSTALLKVTNLTTNKIVFEETKPVVYEKGKTILTLKENPDEYFYGGGVQNGRFSHKGKAIAIENQNSWTDGGVASPTPFYWSTNGYGFMWYTFKQGKYDFGATEKNTVKLSHDTDYLDVFYMINDSPVALLNDFYQLTGNPILLPKFGFYQGHLNAYNRDYWVEDEKGILFEDGKRYKESQKDNFQTEYHKYLVPVTVKEETNRAATYKFAFDAKAAKDVNFNSALSQWAVKGFDGKYTFTLVNRETTQEITLGLQESDVKGEYKVVNAKSNSADVSFNSLKKAAPGEEGADEAKPVNSTTVKFIPVEKVAGFLDLSKDEMEAGIKLEFTGKTALIGEKTFFAKKDKKTEDETTTEMLAPSMKASDAFTLAINKAKGKINDGDKDAVVNYTIQPLVLSCLKDGKIVELKDTLFVPTYNIYYTTPQEGKDDIVTYLGEDLEFATVSGTEKPAEFVFRANADGSYAMMGTDADVSFDEDITAGTNVVSVDPTTGTKFSTEEVLLYNLSEGSFASVAVKVQDNSDKTTLPAESRHASFDNALGSINYQLNKNGITEGILSAESMIFWLDTADSKATTPYFYISKGIEVAEGEEKPAERMFMYNATDSMSIFDENTAQASFNEKYMLEGTTKEDKIAKVIFRPATIAGVDTINTVVEGKAAVVAAKENKAEEVLAGLDNFKFGICLADDAVDGEYVIYSKADNKYVYAKNGKLGLGGKEEAMVFTLGTEVPTSNESIDNAASSIVVTGNAGSVTIQGAQGETAYVRNLLGMPLAETVVTSDNATIAVPAGIVLVTVGDETVKVVVK